MSRKDTREALGRINDGINQKAREGNRITISVDGRPQIRVLSLDPFVCEAYGHIFNRGPRLCGRLALKAFAHADDHTSEEGVAVFALTDTGSEIYGFRLNGQDPHAISLVNDAAAAVGHPEIKMVPSNS